MSIAENIAQIRRNMAQAAMACGRDPAQVQLCAATKMNDADAVRQAIAEPMKYPSAVQGNRTKARATVHSTPKRYVLRR